MFSAVTTSVSRRLVFQVSGLTFGSWELFVIKSAEIGGLSFAAKCFWEGSCVCLFFFSWLWHIHIHTE